MHLSYLSERKDTAVRARWVKKKKTGQQHKLTSLWFLHDRDHLLVDSLVEETNTVKRSFTNTRYYELVLKVDIMVHLITLCFTCLNRCTFFIVLYKNTQPRAYCHHSIIKTDKALSFRRHSGLASAPSAAVASGASDCAGRIVYLRAFWPDKSWKETAEWHVHHRAAHSTKGCEEYIQSWWWEGWSVKNSFNKQWMVNMNANIKKCL